MATCCRGSLLCAAIPEPGAFWGEPWLGRIFSTQMPCVAASLYRYQASQTDPSLSVVSDSCSRPNAAWVTEPSALPAGALGSVPSWKYSVEFSPNAATGVPLGSAVAEKPPLRTLWFARDTCSSVQCCPSGLVAVYADPVEKKLALVSRSPWK